MTGNQDKEEKAKEAADQKGIEDRATYCVCSGAAGAGGATGLQKKYQELPRPSHLCCAVLCYAARTKLKREEGAARMDPEALVVGFEVGYVFVPLRPPAPHQPVDFFL